jgi:gamma-tubulin complex component 5
MENGVLLSDNFFVAKTESYEEIERGTLWHSQYHLRRDSSGNLTAPRFVHHAVNRIFITGKSVVFLKRLLQASQSSEFDDYPLSLTHEDEINFNDVLSGGSDSLAPFSDLFAETFNRWIAGRHHSISSRLRDVLFRDCGLWKSLDAIETIYLAKNGFLFESLAQAIFEKVDRGTQTWNDRFLLTELVQGVFSGFPSIQAQRLRMGVTGEGAKKTGKAYIKEARRTVIFLEGVEIDYKLPWPVLNILIPSSFTTYKRIFTLLLQLRRSKYLLERLNLLRCDDRSTASGMLYLVVKQRLLWFLNIIFTYLTDLVLRPQTEAMRTAMEKAVDVDGMVSVHNRYVDKIREMCLLGQKVSFHPSPPSFFDGTDTTQS